MSLPGSRSAGSNGARAGGRSGARGRRVSNRLRVGGQSSAVSRGLKTTIAILARAGGAGPDHAAEPAPGDPTNPGQSQNRATGAPRSHASSNFDAHGRESHRRRCTGCRRLRPTALEATPIELPLSADPVERSKQLLNALIVKAPAPERRTLPADATLLAFYIQPDGTAIADFSDELSSGTPSGILSEQLAVDSITQTLGANMTGNSATENPDPRAGSGNSRRACGPLRACSLFPRPRPQMLQRPRPQLLVPSLARRDRRCAVAKSAPAISASPPPKKP